MTRDEFLAGFTQQVASSSLRWRLNIMGALETAPLGPFAGAACHCPISFVADRGRPPSRDGMCDKRVWVAGAAVGLDDRDTEEIVCAADANDGWQGRSGVRPYDRTLRAMLLAIVGPYRVDL